jgi:hypothetical protein
MKFKALSVLAVVLLVMLVSAWAADVSGKWVAEMQGRQGPTQTTFTFKVEGAKLTGTVSSPMGDMEISDGKVEGNNISFAVVREFNGNKMTQLYKGVVSGDEIKFTRDMQGGMGGPGGGPGGGAGAGAGGGGGAPKPMEFVAKRAK